MTDTFNLIAREMGREAFKRGIKRAPALDLTNLTPLLKDLPIGGGASEILSSWIAGWDLENLR